MRSSKSVRDLLEAGVLRPGETVYARYHGKTYTATIEADGRIAVKGRGVFRSPSAAADDIAGTNLNGWVFWRVARGNERPCLADIRSGVAE
jgi:Restriction Enzyme Adenine Methylase Associated